MCISFTEIKSLIKYLLSLNHNICIGNNMICSDIWHKYQEWYFKIVTLNFTSRYASEIWDNFEIARVVFMPNITYKIMLLFVYTTTRKSFVIFTCRYFKLSWNINALSQSNCRNLSCSSISVKIQEPVLSEFRKVLL